MCTAPFIPPVFWDPGLGGPAQHTAIDLLGAGGG